MTDVRKLSITPREKLYGFLKGAIVVIDESRKLANSLSQGFVIKALALCRLARLALRGCWATPLIITQ
jgi:hypothetical protein